MSSPLLRLARNVVLAVIAHLATCRGAARRAPRPGCESACVTVVVPDPGELLHRMVSGRAVGSTDVSVTHVERLPARAATVAPWPGWVPDALRERLAQRGVAAPWRHQVTAGELAWGGGHVVVATGTASGKSLAYQLPVFSCLAAEPKATAMYLSPTKALAADQLRAVVGIADEAVRPAGYDGDTPAAERDWIR